MIYFILGMLFYGAAIPVIESVISLICTYMEYLKGKLSVKMVKMQEEINGSEKETTYAIGFHTGIDEEIPEEDDDE